jgi:hypothetical protein
MRPGFTLVFAILVLIVSVLLAILLRSQFVTEAFAPTPEEVEQAQALGKGKVLLNIPLGKRVVSSTGEVYVSVPIIPSLDPQTLSKSDITAPVGTPLNPNNAQMELVTRFYAANPKKPPTSLSLKDQLQFNYDNLSPDIQIQFKAAATATSVMLPGSKDSLTVAPGVKTVVSGDKDPALKVIANLPLGTTVISASDKQEYQSVSNRSTSDGDPKAPVGTPRNPNLAQMQLIQMYVSNTLI